MKLSRWQKVLVALGLVGLFGFGAIVAGINVWAEYHYRQAVKELDRFHPLVAGRHLEQCLRVWPDSGRCYLLAGRAARQAGDFDQAEQYYDECQRLLNITEGLQLERVLLATQKGEVNRTAKFLMPYIERDAPEVPVILEAGVRGSIASYRMSHAQFLLDLWLKKQPDNPVAHLYLAKTRERIGDVRGAQESYQKALSLDPGLDGARVALIETLLELNQPADAVPHLEQLLADDPDNPRLLVFLARAKNSLGQAEESAGLYDRALQRDPRYEPALTGRGRLALQEGNAPEAEKWLRKSLEVYPNNYHVLYSLAQALQNQGKEKESQELLAKSKSIEEDMKRLHAIVTQDMSARPHDPELLTDVALIHLRTGNDQEALRWLNKALRENPRYGPAHDALFKYYQRLGDHKNAEEHRPFVSQFRPEEVKL